MKVSQKQNISKVHERNLKLQRAGNSVGMIGQIHSKFIDKLSKEVETNARTMTNLEQNSTKLSQNEKELAKRVNQLQRQERNLRSELSRVYQMSKIYKNTNIEMEIKNRSMFQELSRSKAETEELKMKMDMLTQLNAILIKITENSLEILPKYKDDCEELVQCITQVNQQFMTNNQHQMSVSYRELKKKLERFQSDVSKIQKGNKKLISHLRSSKIESKSLNERIPLLSSLNECEIMSLQQELQIFNSNIVNAEIVEDQIGSVIHQNCIESHLNEIVISPEEVSKLNLILQKISLSFDQHIHLLETQKMEYQFTKNKKLITCQKYECQICQSYEKIVSQVFSVVRQAFKEVKFMFWREIKQANDVEDFPFLI